jgi:hypothetical protein
LETPILLKLASVSDAGGTLFEFCSRTILRPQVLIEWRNIGTAETKGWIFSENNSGVAVLQPFPDLLIGNTRIGAISHKRWP